MCDPGRWGGRGGSWRAPAGRWPLLLLFAAAACVDIEPGVEARLGLSKTKAPLELRLSIEEARLEPCEEPSSVASVGARLPSILRQLIARPAYAHGQGSEEERRDGPWLAGPAEVMVGEATAWLFAHEVGPGPFCGLRMVAAPLSVRGAAFEIRQGPHAARLIEPMVLAQPFARVRLRRRGLLSIELRFSASDLARALEAGASAREMRRHLRESMHVDVRFVAAEPR